MFFVPPSKPIGKAGERAVCKPAQNRTRWSDGGNNCFSLFICGVSRFVFVFFFCHSSSCVAVMWPMLRVPHGCFLMSFEMPDVEYFTVIANGSLVINK